MSKEILTVEERLAQLQETFHKALPGRMSELETLWGSLVQDWSSEKRDLFHHRIHSLAGSAGTFGAIMLGRAARNIEVQVKKSIESNSPPGKQGLEELKKKMDQLNQLALGWDPASAPNAPADVEISIMQRGNNLIYIVDDDELVGKTIKEELSNADYNVRWFSSAEEFAEACKEWVPAVVIMDMVFSEGDTAGANMVSNLWESLDPRPHVVFLSVRGDVEARLAAVRVGAKRYFTKPVKIADLISTLDTLTERTVSEPYRVLLVDDEEVVNQYYTTVLQEHGIKTHSITNPMKCLDAISAFKPELVLMDVYMPDCSGIELAAIIRQDDSYSQMPIMFLSAETQLDKQLAAMHLGGDDFLTKPIESDHLLEACLARLKRARQNTLLNRRLQHALRESEYRQVALNQHSIVSTTDANGIITAVNKKFCDISKYSESELVGNTHRVINSGHHPVAFFKNMWETITKGKVWYGVLRNRSRDGEHYWVDSTIVPFLDNDGLPYQYISVRTDITDQIRAQEELRAAKEEAEKANLAKSEFLSNMSHELRTPMNAILGFGQLLQSSDIDGTYKEDVDEIVKAGNHQLTLINEILDLAKIEAGHMEVSIEPVQLNNTITGIHSLLMPLLSKYEVTFDKVSRQCLDTWVMADQTRLKQVLLNLFTNGIKYNRTGGLVGLECQEEDGNHVRLIVKDTGVGIPAERQRTLFQPFTRVVDEKVNIEGTGIGLTISKKLVENMGGSIGFQSKEGEGSAFWVKLPKAREPDQVVGNLEITRSNKKRNDFKEEMERKLILYIEDNPANLRLVQKILGTRSEFELLTAHEPGIGLELAEARHPDLILLDINLPGIDGYEVLKRLRSIPQTKSIPVIAVTAKAMLHDMEKGLKAGFDSYIPKPIDVNLFMEVIDSKIRKQ